MQTNNQLKQELDFQLTNAISASEKIISCLQSGDFDQAKKLDLQRVDFIRLLAKYRNFDDLMPSFGNQFRKLSELNQSIISISHSLRDDVLTQLCSERTNKQSHQQYLQNQRLTSQA